MTKNTKRWGLAAGLAAALALHGTAGAQAGSAAGGQSGSSGAQGGSGSGMSGSQSGQAQGAGSGSGSATGSRSTDSTASGSATGTGATGSSAGARSGAAGSAQALDKGLQESLEKIHASNQAEVHMAQMGQQSAQSPQVKEYAQKIGEDHQKLDEKLTTAAQSAGAASLEGKAFQKQHEKATKDMDKLQKKTGAEFDKAYMDAMVKDHEKDLKEVKDAAKDARKQNHTELAALLEQAQTGMQGHLDEAKQIRDSLQGRRAQGRRGDTGADRSGTGSGSSAPTDRAGPTGASPQGAGGPGTGTGSAGSGSNPSLPDRGSSQPGGSSSPDRTTK